MRRLRELLSYLSDPRKARLFRCDDPNEYILLADFLHDLGNARDRAGGASLALPAELDALIELLDEIETETQVRPVYNEGRTMYLDASGRLVQDPRRRWQEYVAADPKWKRAQALARGVMLDLEPEPPGLGRHGGGE